MDKRLKKILIIFGAVLCAALIVLVGYRIYIGVIVPQNGVECGVQKDDATGNIIMDASPQQLADKSIVPGCSVELRFEPGYAFVEVPVLSGDYLNPMTDYLQISNGQAIFQTTKEKDLYKAFDCKPETKAIITVVSKDKYSALENAGQALKSPQANCQATTFDAPYLKFGLRMSFNNNEIAADNEAKIDLLSSYNINSFNIKNRTITSTTIGTLFKICDTAPQSVLVVSGQDYDNASLYCALLQCIAGANYCQLEQNYRKCYADGFGLDPNSEEISAFVKYRLDEFLHKLSKTPDYADLKSLDYGYVAEQWLRAHGVETDDVRKIQNAFTS